MAKKTSLVEIADMIATLSPNEMATLGKIVMAKQTQMSGGMQVNNVPGPMAAPPTGMTARPPQQLPPQMMQQQRDKDHEEAMNIPQEEVNAFIQRLDNPVMREPMFEGDRPYMSAHDELRHRAMRQTLVQRPSAYPRSMSYVDESGRTRYLDLPQDYYEEVRG